MKDRTTWAFVAFAAVLLGAVYFWRKSLDATPPATAPVAASRVLPPASAIAAPAPAPANVTVVRAELPPPVPTVRAGPNGEEVPILDGKTIDMSSGRAVVRDDAKSRAALAKGVQEMEDAAREVTFGPPKPAPAPDKKAEPAAAPPKP